MPASKFWIVECASRGLGKGGRLGDLDECVAPALPRARPRAPARRAGCRRRPGPRSRSGRGRCAALDGSTGSNGKRRPVSRADEGGDVGDARGEEAGRVERPGKGLHADRRQQAEARLVAGDAAKGGRADDRAAGLRADARPAPCRRRRRRPNRTRSRRACGPDRAGCACRRVAGRRIRWRPSCRRWWRLWRASWRHERGIAGRAVAGIDRASPCSVGMSAVSKMSLTPTATPASGPRCPVAAGKRRPRGRRGRRRRRWRRPSAAMASRLVRDGASRRGLAALDGVQDGQDRLHAFPPRWRRTAIAAEQPAVDGHQAERDQQPCRATSNEFEPLAEEERLPSRMALTGTISVTSEALVAPADADQAEIEDVGEGGRQQRQGQDGRPDAAGWPANRPVGPDQDEHDAAS